MGTALRTLVKEAPSILRREWRALRRRRAPWVTGIDFDGNALKVAQIEETREGKRLRLRETLELCDPETGEIPEETRRRLEQCQVHRGRLVTFLPRDRVTLKRMVLPTCRLDELRQLAPFEASRLLPRPPEELVADVEIIAPREDGHCEVWLAAVGQDQIREHLALLDKLGLEPDKIEVSTSALARAVERAGEEAALCYVGQSRADVLILSGPVSRFSRGVALSASNGGAGALADEIVRSIRYGRRETAADGEASLILLDGTEREAELAPRLRRAFPIQTDWRPPILLLNGQEPGIARYAPAIGAALDPGEG